VLIYLDDGVMTRKEGDKSTRIEFRRGDVRWRPASGAYTAENISDHPIRILEVDLKGPPKGPTRVTNLDPVAVDSTHFKVLLDNESVRVLRPLRPSRDEQEPRASLQPRDPLLERSTNGKADEVRVGDRTSMLRRMRPINLWTPSRRTEISVRSLGGPKFQSEEMASSSTESRSIAAVPFPGQVS